MRHLTIHYLFYKSLCEIEVNKNIQEDSRDPDLTTSGTNRSDLKKGSSNGHPNPSGQFLDTKESRFCCIQLGINIHKYPNGKTSQSFWRLHIRIIK